MSIPLGADVFTIIRPAGTDWQGDPAGDATEADITGCSFQPNGSTETNSGGDTVSAGGAGFLPAGSDILATDRVRLANGDVYAVDGKPARWADDTGTEDHVQVQLRRIEGV